MRQTRIATAASLALAQTFTLAQQAALSDDSTARSLGVVTVTSGRPSSLPTLIPTTLESVTREQIDSSINAFDPQDALKYLPSLSVRKRYIGDHNHAVLASRASGAGNPARSVVYADGMLLSNYLGNGATNTPRWIMVTPEEIDRVDVMYGPFSAAYPGNSVGAVIDYVTRMPTQFEAHGKVAFSSQPFELYNSQGTFLAHQVSASAGNRSGDGSWWFNVNHAQSRSQPLTFVTASPSKTAAIGSDPVVTGSVASRDRFDKPWLILGTGTQYDTTQDHAKVKLAYDLGRSVRATYLLGVWQTDTTGHSESYLRRAGDNSPVHTGSVAIDGKRYTLKNTDFSGTREDSLHLMHGVSVKSHTQGVWDWEVAASLYDLARDRVRQSNGTTPTSLPYPQAQNGGPGTLVDQSGSGWNTLALKGVWRPTGKGGEHLVNFGLQREHYTLRNAKTNLAGNWLSDRHGTPSTRVQGQAEQWNLHGQDAWKFAPGWLAVMGLRGERWSTSNGLSEAVTYNATGTTPTGQSRLRFDSRHDVALSPKLAISRQWSDDLVFKASLGRAVRMPTVGELYGATSTVNSQYINDPNLSPERSLTTELSAEKDLGNATLRVTLFTENTRDALYSQREDLTIPGQSTLTLNRVQNIGRFDTQGVELFYNGQNVLARGLDLSASVTYADSRVKDNKGYVDRPGDTVGKVQPRVPDWRATALATYRFSEQFSAALGARYSARQFTTLNNSDSNGRAYQGVSPFLTADLRLRHRFSPTTSVAFGIDNLTNDRYWNFHPYPQRSYSLEVSVDL